MLRITARIRKFLLEEGRVYLTTPEKKPVLKQFVEMIQLKKRYRFLPYQYIKHGLYRQSFNGNIHDFLPPELIHRYRDTINPTSDWHKVIDKKSFAQAMHKAGVPAVANLAIIYADKSIICLNNDTKADFHTFLQHLVASKQTACFLKPTHGGSGRDVFKATVQQNRLLINNQSVDEQTLFNMMFSSNRYKSYLVQPFIRQHPLLNQISETSVNTVRIDTFIKDGEVYHNAAVLRIGSGKTCTDNWATGGMICNIDLTTGELSATAKTKAKYGNRSFHVHPVTQFRFAGTVLPYWNEVKSAVCMAARALQPLRSLGWDVAIGEHGPILIEANQDYDIFLMQEGIGGLRKTPIGSQVVGKTCINNI